MNWTTYILRICRDKINESISVIGTISAALVQTSFRNCTETPNNTASVRKERRGPLCFGKASGETASMQLRWTLNCWLGSPHSVCVSVWGGMMNWWRVKLTQFFWYPLFVPIAHGSYKHLFNTIVCILIWKRICISSTEIVPAKMNTILNHFEPVTCVMLVQFFMLPIVCLGLFYLLIKRVEMMGFSMRGLNFYDIITTSKQALLKFHVILSSK